MSKTFLTTLTILFVLFCHSVGAQDTIRVFFDFGKSQLTKETKNTLKDIPLEYDLYAADSIAFIGYADSVGRFDANIRLSLKRARNVRKFMKPFLDEGKPISVYAKGEDAKKTDEFARRVSVVLYYPKEEIVTTDGPPEIIHADPKCFKIAMYALAYCNVTEIKKRKKKYARLEAEKTAIIEDTTYYYLRNYRDGRREAKRVKWKETVTGKLWWKRKRLVAEIPLESFDKSNFFTLDTGDCPNCNIGNLLDEDKTVRYVERNIADEFLMANINMKKRWLRRSTYKIKVPSEYVDLAKTYYSAYTGSFCDFTELEPIEWKRKRGRRRREMLFADIKTVKKLMPYIVTSVTLMECHNRVCYWPHGGDCIFERKWGALVPYIGFQAGVVNQNDTTLAYIGTRLSATNDYLNFSLDVGLNSQVGVFTNASADYKLFMFGLRYEGMKGGWISPSNNQFQLRSIQYMYTGLASKLSTNRLDLSYVETNVHLGWGWESSRNVFINRLFVEGGIARDWTGLSNTTFYPFVHAGMRFDVSLFKSPTFTRGLHR